ncbi:hypothetical protein QYM36_002748 [Artemia franciscana]|uniref:Uncharacterized protein n=1 Tax=Artemia franciscana TaxID=6661 RepID=A0AA88I3V5_ARTSF|nr:hypothetical protein QYM36_002748 [Artemia franciscana]
MQPIASVLMKDGNKEIKENIEHVKALLKVTSLLGRLGTDFRRQDETESPTNKEDFVDTCILLTDYTLQRFSTSCIDDSSVIKHPINTRAILVQ